MASSCVLCLTYIIIIIISFDNASNTISLFKGGGTFVPIHHPFWQRFSLSCTALALTPVKRDDIYPIFAPRFPLEIGEESNSKGTRLFMVQRYLQGAYEQELLTVKTHRCLPTFSPLSHALVNSFLVFNHTISLEVISRDENRNGARANSGRPEKQDRSKIRWFAYGSSFPCSDT